jgi:NhaA family Na+:H+ antiporter
VVPLFALATGGVPISASSLHDAAQGRIALGIFAGLAIGKPLGILLASALAVRTGIAALPEGVRWSQVAGAGALGGIGFTVSLFIAGLAFEGPAAGDEARIGIIAASLAAGVAGYAWLRLSPSRQG